MTEFYGIRSEITVFVPMGASVLVRDMRFMNLTGEALALDAIGRG